MKQQLAEKGHHVHEHLMGRGFGERNIELVRWAEEGNETFKGEFVSARMRVTHSISPRFIISFHSLISALFMQLAQRERSRSRKAYIVINGREKFEKPPGPRLNGLGVNFHGWEQRGRNHWLSETVQESPKRVREGVHAAGWVKCSSRVQTLSDSFYFDGIALR